MPDDFIAQLKEAASRTIERLRERLALIRTDRSSPSLVENVFVEYGGSRLGVKHLASIATPDSRNILITPWDRSSIEAIAKALEGADLGVMPVVAGTDIRITLPPLSEERRKLLAREVGERVEEARIVLRRARDESSSVLRDAFKQKTISEDLFFKHKQELDRIVQNAQKEMDASGEQKQKEILGTS